MDDATPPDTEPVPAPGSPRLYRSTTRRLLGGVAGGIGERFDLDPNIVRVAFVVLTVLWGFGVVLYLAMWVLIPRRPAEGEAEPSRRAGRLSMRWIAAGIVAALAFVVLLAFIPFSGNHMLHHGPAVGRGLFLLWVGFLAVLGVVVLRSGAGRSFGRVMAVLFLTFLSAVILLVGGVFAFLAATGVPLTGGVGARAWFPTRLADVRHTYRTEIGAETIDLRGVRFPVSGYRIVASVAVGRLQISVGPDTVVALRTRVGVGTVSNGFVQYWSPTRGVFISGTPPMTSAQLARAPHLTLDAQVGIGRIDLYRAPSSAPVP